MTRIRVGVILADSTRKRTKIEAREFEINKEFEDIHAADIMPLLKKGESMHGYCPVEANNE